MHLIKTTFRIVTLSSLVVAGILGSVAQQARPSAKNSNAETGLVGVKLFDPGSKVIRLYGSPDEIQAIGNAGTGVAGGGGGNSGGGGGGGNDGTGGGRGTRSADDLKTSRERLIGDPFDVGEGDWEIRQLRPNDGGGAGSPEAGGREGGGSSDTGGGGAAGGTGDGERTIFTRWVYKRSTGKYAFVFDKANRVIQIETVGIRDSKVRTRRGVTYGAFFGDLIKKYGAPDAYEINGTNLVVRFLVKDRVAFRLTKLDPKGKQRVTGIVIAAGKE